MMKKKIFLFLVLPVFALILLRKQSNNTCTTFEGYLNIFFSRDCYYSPDFDDDIHGIIRRYAGSSETHQVQTEDGYILTLFRIPRDNPKNAILLQHPAHGDARIYVTQYNNSLAFVLWRAGYDVWIGNIRGTYYSKNHTTLKPSEPAFWNYSLHETGYYDQSATVGYITRKLNGTKIIYFGMSMSGSAGLIYASTRPEEAAESIKFMILVAPVSFFRHGSTILRTIGPELFAFQERYVSLYRPVTEYDAWGTRLVQFLMINFPFKQFLMHHTVYPVFGSTPDEFDPSLVNMLAKITGSAVSMKLYRHMYQLFAAGGLFQMYDYREEENVKLYGVKHPPLYPLEKIKLPVFLVSGENDTLIDPLDNEVLFSKLPTKSRAGKLSVEGFNHIDFIFGKHRLERFYTKILQLLNTIE